MLMADFDYKQRPFSKKLTDEEYNRAVGRSSPGPFPWTAKDFEELHQVCPVCLHNNQVDEHCGGPWHYAE